MFGFFFRFTKKVGLKNSWFSQSKFWRKCSPLYRKIRWLIYDKQINESFDSGKYWEKRYAIGGNSGSGSYNHLAIFKAETINDFVKNNFINSVIEFGCGDGNQLSLAKYPKYLGFDISETAINICKNKFLDDKTKEFRQIESFKDDKAELVLSLDVIYHLVEDDIFENYMKRLFDASIKFVIIYSSNKTDFQLEHVKSRKFTDWIDANAKNWKLLQFIPNKYSELNGDGNDLTKSFADFYVFGRV